MKKRECRWLNFYDPKAVLAPKLCSKGSTYPPHICFLQYFCVISPLFTAQGRQCFALDYH